MARERKIDPKLVDELLKDQDPKNVFEQDGLFGELKKTLVVSSDTQTCARVVRGLFGISVG